MVQFDGLSTIWIIRRSEHRKNGPDHLVGILLAVDRLPLRTIAVHPQRDYALVLATI